LVSFENVSYVTTSVQPGVASPIHLTDAALADEGNDFTGTKAGPNDKGHGFEQF